MESDGVRHVNQPAIEVANAIELPTIIWLQTGDSKSIKRARFPGFLGVRRESPVPTPSAPSTDFRLDDLLAEFLIERGPGGYQTVTPPSSFFTLFTRVLMEYDLIRSAG